jgi:cystathionine beta-lyase
LGKKEQKWNFNEVIDRTGTNAIKWEPEYLKLFFGQEDLLPLWVADMDFRAPQILIDRLVARAEHGIFGYTGAGKAYRQAVIDWFERKHNWSIDEDWLQFSPGVVPAINFIIQAFSHPGDKVIIQEPVYYPFKSSIENNGRQVLINELLIKDNKYLMDFDDLEKLCEDKRARIFILCNPHNPVARVWTKEELKKLAEICLKHNILVIADEIHCDLTFNDHKHIPYPTISKECAQNCIVTTAPSKTFNIAGMKTSNMITPNDELRQTLQNKMESLSIRGPTIFGAIALETVYNEGDEWLASALQYIQANYDFLKGFIENSFPNCTVFDLEGTYLAWVDFRSLGLEPKKLDEVIKKEAQVALDDGAMFGKSGEGFQRFNLACPQSILEEALNRMLKALKPYFK